MRNLMLSVKKDTESLIEHRDPSSFRSLFTDKGSKMRQRFRFDKFLLQTEVYASQYRNLVEGRVRDQLQGSALPGETPHENREANVLNENHPVMMPPSPTTAIDNESWTEKWQRAKGQLDKARGMTRRRILLLLLGASSSDRAALMTLLAISCQEEPGLDQLGRYRPAIYQAVINDVKLLLETIRRLHIELLPGIDADMFQTVLQYDTSGPVHHMNEHLLTTLTTLRGLPGLSTALKQPKGAFPERAL
jgi:hypothetical protein